MSNPKQELDQLLRALGESFLFATSGSMPPALPGLEVKGVGSIGFPLSAADAQRLIAKATQAPYGRGEETIVDTNVRRVWQFEPSHFSLRNREWDTHLATIVDMVRKEFGIHPKVKAELYKLLIYEKGSFFVPHRDTEKMPGMFATLVVCLPSLHEGGTLVVSHDSQIKRIDFGGENSEFQMQYAAFYADCQHEITPVTDGYRICLVYNLAIAGKKQPLAPSNAAVVEKAAQLLKELFDDTSSDLSKIAIPFTHQYTQAGLDPSQLKGSDRALADVLVRAAVSLDYQGYFALLTHHQSGEADYETMDYDMYRERRSYGWSYDEDEEEYEDSDESEVGIGEICEEDWSLDHWLDAQGQKQPFGEIHLEEDEILSEEGKEDWAFRQEVEEATGNAGVSVERWYRQGVIVIWPREHYFGILAEEGQASAIPALEKMVAHGKKPAAVDACRSFTEQIIDHWQPRQGTLGDKAGYPARMLKLLDRIGTVELVQRFLRDVFPKDYDGSEGKVLTRLFQRFGWQPFDDLLQDFLAHQKPQDYFARLGPIVSICEQLCCEAPSSTEERRAVCASLTEELAKVIERWDKRRRDSWYADQEERTGVVDKVVHIFSWISMQELLDHFVTHVLTDTRHYDLHEVLIPDVKAIYQWLPKVPAAQTAATRIMQHCITELRAATAHAIELPKDWKREAKLYCKCEDCVALSRFLRDPTQQVGRFSIRQDRRQHLHEQIEEHQCDCTHVTERKGSPQTLVCTKTQASYERRLKQFGVDKKLLAELEAIEAGKQTTAVRRSSSRRKAKK